jgi:tetratricopeptide (TPR) repeat protein
MPKFREIIVVLAILFFSLRFFQGGWSRLDLRTLMGGGLCMSGEDDKAIATLSSSLKHIPCASDVDTYWWLGQCYDKRKDWAKTYENYNGAIETYNKIFPAGDSISPFICFLKGVRSHNIAWSYEGRAFANARMHNYEQAVADYTKSIETVQPWGADVAWRKAGWARYQRSICYYALGKTDLAEKDLAQLKADGYWGYLDKESRPTSSNWYNLINY